MHLLKIIVVLQLNVPDYLMVFYQYKFEDLEKLFSFIQIINNILLYLNMSKESIFIFRAHQDQSFIFISELTIHLKHYKILYMLICILLTFLESLPLDINTSQNDPMLCLWLFQYIKMPTSIISFHIEYMQKDNNYLHYHLFIKLKLLALVLTIEEKYFYYWVLYCINIFWLNPYIFMDQQNLFFWLRLNQISIMLI